MVFTQHLWIDIIIYEYFAFLLSFLQILNYFTLFIIKKCFF